MRLTHFIIALTAIVSAGCTPVKQPGPQIDGFIGLPSTQKTLKKVALMPDMPSTYRMLDWKQKALDYDAYVFDWNRNDEVGPLIWLDQSWKNIKQNTFGLYTTVGDVRQGSKNPGSHEGINTIAAVLGGGLVGIDKTQQDGYNYPKMLQNYFAKDNNWKIMLNNTSGFAGDWWYNVLPNVLYFGVCDVFPGVEGADEIQKTIADQFLAAENVLNGKYDWSYFNFATMQGVRNNLPQQQDAAGGHGYILLSAYRKFKDEAYLEAAKSAIGGLNNLRESRFYEVLYPFGAYTAAYLNAVHETFYDVEKMLNFMFTGCFSGSGRYGWGVTHGKWGPYDVSGLQGSVTDGGGYAFFMNSIEMACPLVPMVKYAPEFAASIGKWMLNNASACRLYYPTEIADAHQFAPELKNLTYGNVAYEGLRYSDRYGVKNTCPIAEGDGPSWTSKNPTSSMFSLYSTSPVGILGAIVNTTNVEGILRLDCNVTDFYAERPYPVNLYWNPYSEEKEVTYIPGEGMSQGKKANEIDLFDIVSRTIVAKNISGFGSFKIPAKAAMILVEIPADAPIKYHDNESLSVNGHIIAY